MTFADRLHRTRRPRPWAKFTTAQVTQMMAGLHDEITREHGKTRAHAEWVASWLEQRASAHDKDARHHGTHHDRRLAHRMAADDLRALLLVLDEGPQQ